MHLHNCTSIGKKKVPLECCARYLSEICDRMAREYCWYHILNWPPGRPPMCSHASLIMLSEASFKSIYWSFDTCSSDLTNARMTGDKKVPLDSNKRTVLLQNIEIYLRTLPQNLHSSADVVIELICEINFILATIGSKKFIILCHSLCWVLVQKMLIECRHFYSFWS